MADTTSTPVPAGVVFSEPSELALVLRPTASSNGEFDRETEYARFFDGNGIEDQPIEYATGDGIDRFFTAILLPTPDVDVCTSVHHRGFQVFCRYIDNIHDP